MYNDYLIDYDELPPDPLIEGQPSTFRGIKEEDWYDDYDEEDDYPY